MNLTEATELFKLLKAGRRIPAYPNLRQWYETGPENFTFSIAQSSSESADYRIVALAGMKPRFNESGIPVETIASVAFFLQEDGSFHLCSHARILSRQDYWQYVYYPPMGDDHTG
jgi:hypothetical protein